MAYDWVPWDPLGDDRVPLVPWAVPSLPLSSILVSRISLVVSLCFSLVPLWFGLVTNSVRVLVNNNMSDVMMSFMI